MTKTIAIIEDNTRFMNYFCDIFQGKKEFSSIHKATDCKEAERLLEARPIDIVFIDLGLPDGNGLAIIDKVSKCWPRCSIIVLSIYADSKTIMLTQRQLCRPLKQAHMDICIKTNQKIGFWSILMIFWPENQIYHP